MRSRVAFIGAVGSLVAVFAASASPIPLCDVYRRADGFSHADLALTAVAYFVAVMAALLVLGRLSNHLGRRPVALAALAITAVGTLVLTDVHSVTPLILGRVLQGIGCGLASSAIAAFVVDSAPASPAWLASAVTTGSPMVGLTVGALGSGALAEYGPAPRTLAYLIAPGLLAACAALIAAGRETVARGAGAAASLRPQVRIPRAARRLLPAAAATFLATRALGGFYQAFGPSVVADQLGTTNTLIAAAGGSRRGPLHDLPHLRRRRGDPGPDRRSAVAERRPVRDRARLRRPRGGRLRVTLVAAREPGLQRGSTAPPHAAVRPGPDRATA